MRITGRSFDFTTCEHCGRENLKVTIIMDNGVHYGTGCAANALGIERATVTKRASTRQDEADLKAIQADATRPDGSLDSKKYKVLWDDWRKRTGRRATA